MPTRTREPQEGLRRHKLLPKDVAATIPPLYSQDGKGMDAIVYLKLFCPYGRATYYITEASVTDEDTTFFGYIVSPLGPDCDELGYMSFGEMANARAFGAVPAIERDMHYGGIGKTIRECLENQ